MSDNDRVQERYDRIRENAKRYGEKMSDAERRRYREMVPPPGARPEQTSSDKKTK